MTEPPKCGFTYWIPGSPPDEIMQAWPTSQVESPIGIAFFWERIECHWQPLSLVIAHAENWQLVSVRLSDTRRVSSKRTLNSLCMLQLRNFPVVEPREVVTVQINRPVLEWKG